ncbi:MAG: ankyrin repeat domain-containing protein [bacterium]
MEIFEHVKRNNLFELKKYLQFGDINIINSNSKSLLHYSVEFKAIDCINLLVDNYINLNLKDIKQQTPIFDAAIKGNLGILKLLIKSGCDVNVTDEYGNIPLFYAIKTNNVAIVDLLTIHSDLSIRNNKKEDALFIAIKFKYNNIDKFINNNLNIMNYQNETALFYAVKYNNLTLLKEYCNRYLINQKNLNKETLFFYAVKYSSRDVIRFLLEFMPCLDITNRYGETLFEIVKLNCYKIEDLIDNYKYSLEYINYKSNNKIIYNYLSNNEINLPISKIILNKKDNFSLSLIDYLNFYNDKENIKKVAKVL